LDSSVTGLIDLLDQDVQSLKSSDPADSMFLAPSSQDEMDVVEEGEGITCSEPTQSASPKDRKLLVADLTSGSCQVITAPLQ